MYPKATIRYLCGVVLAVLVLTGAMSAQAQQLVNVNGDFEQSTVGQTSGIMNWGLWWNAANGQNAAAQIVADPADATNKVLRVELTDKSGVANPWDIQVVHHADSRIALVEGHRYQVSFRIRAENPNAATISLDGGAGAQIWGRAISGANWTTVESAVFTAGAGQSRNFGIHLAAGANPQGQVFYIDDMRVVDLDATSDPDPDPDPDPPQPGVVNVNGDFEQSTLGQTSGIANWALWWEKAGADASAEIVADPSDATNQVLRLELTDKSGVTDPWDIQVVHYGGTGLALVEGHRYQVSFRIRAENPNAATISLDGGAGAQIWGRAISGEDWTTVQSDVFTAGAGQSRSFGIHLAAGANPEGQVFYIDDMRVVDLDAVVDPDPDPDPDPPQPGLVNVNGDFEQSELGQTSGITNWALWWEKVGADASAEIVVDPSDATNQVLRLELTDKSGVTDPWDIQVVHYGGTGLALVEGHRHQVSFRIRAENPTAATISLDAGAGAQIWGRDISGEGWTTVESAEFTADATPRSFGIHLAAPANPVGQVFYIDDMMVIDLDAPVDPDPDPDPDPSTGTELIVNGGFESGLSSWTTHRGGRLTLVTDEVHSGDNAVLVTQRGETGTGPLQYLTGKVRQGERYYFSAWVKYTEGPDEKLFQMAMQNGPTWQGIEIMGGAMIPRGEWGQIEGYYTVPENADLSQTFIFLETVWVQTPTAFDDLMDFYADDISVIDLATQLEAARPVIVQAEEGEIGSEFETITQDGVTFIRITTDHSATTGTPSYPGANRTASYTVTFPESGWYDLYARVRVGPGGFDDDSFFYGSEFGERNPANAEDWTMINGLAAAGFSQPDAWVVGPGVDGSGMWKWVNVSKNSYQSATSDSFYVSSDALTRTFQIGARENGLDIDRFAFAPSHLLYTVSNLDNREPGVVEIPGDPIPEPTGPPLADGLNKWVGNIHSPPQLQHFEKYWNQVTSENAGKWGSVEGTRGVYNWGALDQSYDFAKEHGFPYRFHVLTWGGQQPGWINDLSTEEQLEAITQWYDAVAERYPDMEYVEVVNEGSNGHQLPDGISGSANYIAALGGTNDVYGTGFDWIITAFEMARERFPNSKLMINDYNIVCRGEPWCQQNVVNYRRIIEELQARDLIDVIGVQAHAFSTRGSAAGIRSALDYLAETGLPIQATEMDIQGNSALTQEASDQLQLQNMQKIFPTFWEHPAVEGITFWGWRPGLWMDHAELVRANGEERPALVWLRQYLDGFRDVSNEDMPVAASFTLSGNYPNPVSGTTQISYQLAEPVSVTLKVYDLLGREVRTLVDAQQTPGQYTVPFDAAQLSSGVYFYRLQAGSFSDTRQMVVVK